MTPQKQSVLWPSTRSQLTSPLWYCQNTFQTPSDSISSSSSNTTCRDTPLPSDTSSVLHCGGQHLTVQNNHAIKVQYHIDSAPPTPSPPHEKRDCSTLTITPRCAQSMQCIQVFPRITVKLPVYSTPIISSPWRDGPRPSANERSVQR